MRPSCSEDLFPSETFIGERAHILSFSEGGEQTPENLILLCPNCHTTIDKTNLSHAQRNEMALWKRRRQEELRLCFSQSFATFDALSAKVTPLLASNKQIWQDYGPSPDHDEYEVRRDLWETFEPELLSNNRLLIAYFTNNSKLFHQDNWSIVERFIAHAREFELTRGASPQLRKNLFPSELNSIFGLAPTQSAIAYRPLVAVQNFCERLIDEGRFIDFSFDPLGRSDDYIRYRDVKGNEVTISLHDTPRVRQEFWNTSAYRPKRRDFRQNDLEFILEWFEKWGVPWNIEDPTRLYRVTIRENQDVYLIYEYNVTKQNLYEVGPESGGIVVNQHGWNGGPFTPEACKLAVEQDLMLLNQENFLAWVKDGLMPAERVLRSVVREVPLTAISNLYLFGSALHCDRPSDIDLVATYPDSTKPERVESDKQRTIERVQEKSSLPPLDFTIFGESELRESGFLDRINYRAIPL